VPCPELNAHFSEQLEAIYSGIFQVIWGLQEAAGALTFFNLRGIDLGILPAASHPPPTMIQLLVWSRYERAHASMPLKHSECLAANKIFSTVVSINPHLLKTSQDTE